jgi:hypothetical protein
MFRSCYVLKGEQQTYRRNIIQIVIVKDGKLFNEWREIPRLFLRDVQENEAKRLG